MADITSDPPAPDPPAAAVPPAGPATRADPPATVAPDAPPSSAAGTGEPAAAGTRSPLLGQGAAAALVGCVLALLSPIGAGALVAVVLVLQVLLVLAVLMLLRAPARALTAGLAAAAALAGDVAMRWGDGDVGPLGAVLAVAFVATLLLQLARRSRSSVTASMADTVLVVVLASSAACLVALRELAGGSRVLTVALTAGAATLLAGRVGDHLRPAPLVLPAGVARGWPGLLLGLASGAAVGSIVGAIAAAAGSATSGRIGGGHGALVGLGAAAAVCVADLAVEVAAAGLPLRGSRSRWASLRPVGALLPYAVLGPVALVAGRLVLP